MAHHSSTLTLSRAGQLRLNVWFADCSSEPKVKVWNSKTEPQPTSSNSWETIVLPNDDARSFKRALFMAIFKMTAHII